MAARILGKGFRADEVLALVRQQEQLGMLYAPDTKARIAACNRLAAHEVLSMPYIGIYARPDYLKQLTPQRRAFQLIKTLGRLHPDWVFCSYSAACLHGLWVPQQLLKRIHIAVPMDVHTGSSASIVRHHMKSIVTQHVSGVTATSYWTTVADCLRHATFFDAMPIADSALRFAKTDSAALQDAVERYGRSRKGVKQARVAARHADGRSESGGESRMRAHIIYLGYQIPDLQVELENPLQPQETFRVDGLWILEDGSLIVIEYDGWQKYQIMAARDQDYALGGMLRERKRESLLTSACSGVIRVTSQDLVTPGKLEQLLDTFHIPREAKCGERLA